MVSAGGGGEEEEEGEEEISRQRSAFNVRQTYLQPPCLSFFLSRDQALWAESVR